MKNRAMVELGLNGLARAGDVGWFHGHFGAAVLAGERLLRRADFSSEVKRGITDQVERARGATPALFLPLPPSPTLPNYEMPLLQALKPHLEALHLSGHGVIYGALALQALRETPELATRSRVEGIVRLIGLAITDRSYRYNGVDDYHAFSETVPVEIPHYTTVPDMTRAAFAECAELYPDGPVGNQFYFFTAEKLHGITFAHALHTLQELGYAELTQRGMATHRKALVLNRQRPPGGQPTQVVARDGVTPYSPDYWAIDHFDDHKLKLAIAALELLETLPPEGRQRVYDPMRFWIPFQR